MALNVKSKILLTVLSVVVMFTFFILFYFPSRQERSLMENYSDEIENFANSVALGVKIALTEQNFEGVETAIDFVREDERLQFVSIIQVDSVWNSATESYEIQKSVFKTFPEGIEIDVNGRSNESFIYKTAAFSTPVMTGEVMLSFSTREIIASMQQIRMTSILASLVVFSIGLGIGYLLAKNISNPVLALRDAANKVGEGDLSQYVSSNSRDEIGELAVAFNKMVRELKIEDALETIRNRTITMEHSEEWEKVIHVFFDQLRHLGFDGYIFRVILRDEKKNRLHHWLWIKGEDPPEKYVVSGDTAAFDEMYDDALRKDESYEVNELSPDANTGYAEILYNQTGDSHHSKTGSSAGSDPWIVSTALTTHGAVEIIDDTALSSSDVDVLHRLAKVIDQSYTRYLDLLKSEAQALEVTKQASLDRIRAEVASMRSKDDLNKITPLVWRELKALNVSFMRCGVFILDEAENTILCFLTTPDGQALGFFTMDIQDTELTSIVYDAWKKAEVVTEQWKEEDFLKWTKRLTELGHIENHKKYQGGFEIPQLFHLHFVPFKQGMLYVGNEEPLSSNDLELVQSLADVFSIAFARYEDFSKLEKAKNEIERTLTELKSTQSQLLLAEKMASLGELTAGIAHEIQNPLNFVNNFSELSGELLEELNEEIEMGNEQEILAIAEYLKENLEKINHHGERASSIVRGMLEHSRDGNREKELCDINKIAEEYLRLAYHGLRAKDKSFQAEFELDLDESLPKVNAISQDISRVLLNLINNAFYAVSEKAKREPEEYQPCVTVRTRKAGDHVEIVVEDNGDGIPKDVADKIFQPFFTTKPTGKGTGLGLSISYDIVTKGHNGSLSVTTKHDNKGNSETGTEFTVSLPVG